jgi:HicB family
MGSSSEAIGKAIMRKSNFALRLQPSLLDEARKLAEAEGVALNQLINVAVAEKVSALRTESYIAERAARAALPEALRVLMRAGRARPPAKGDEMPGRKSGRR